MPNLTVEPGSRFDRILTFVLANVLWFVFAVLIVTLPAATAGLFAALAPLARGHDTELFATFFGTMRRQWLKSTLLFAADLLVAGLIALNMRLLDMMNLAPLAVWLLRSLYLFVALAALMANVYLWPLLVLFDLRLRRLLSASVRLAFAHPAWTLLTLALALIPLGIGLVVPLWITVLAVFSTSVLAINWGAWQVIRRYATPDELAELYRH